MKRHHIEKGQEVRKTYEMSVHVLSVAREPKFLTFRDFLVYSGCSVDIDSQLDRSDQNYHS
jgi:hypothetical protein